MLSFYIFCLIVGGILIAFSIFIGGEHDSSIETSASSELHSIENSVNSESISEINQFNHTDTNPSLHINNSIGQGILQFLNLRYITYFIGFFGLTGTILGLLQANSILTFISSTIIGSLASVVGFKFYNYLLKSETITNDNINDLIGKTGKVILRVNKKNKGKVLVDLGNRTTEITAKVSDISEVNTFDYGRKVLIMEIKNNIAFIINSEI